jgi:hypothetical protein
MSNAIFFKVEYINTNIFDLTVAKTASEFMFQLYNFLSAAVADNDSFHEPERRLRAAKASVAQRGYPPLPKRKHEETENDKSNGSRNSSYNSSCGQPAPLGAQDSFDNPSVQREITRAGYTLAQPLPKEWKLLTPVSHNSCPCAR